MSFYLALSCLQGQPMDVAIEELLKLEPDGIQLTPGCIPNKDGADLARGLLRRGKARLHDGFSLYKAREEVWEKDDALGWCPRTNELEAGVDGLGSIHGETQRHVPTKWTLHPPPPRRPTPETLLQEEADDVARVLAGQRFWQPGFSEWIANCDAQNLAVEVMYETKKQQWWLGTCDQVCRAMRRRLRLAVDVSHLFIQNQTGPISDGSLRWYFGDHQELEHYSVIEEIHVSANSGGGDTHKPLEANSYGLGWARERAQNGTAVVLECYMHRLSFDERRRQCDLVRKKVTG